LQTFLCSNCDGICLCPKIATIWVLLRSCSSETLELWPRLFFLNWYRFFSLNPLWICLCSSRYGVGCTMGLLLWNFWAIGSFWMDLRLLLHQKHYKIGIALVWFSFPCSFLNGQKVVCFINKVINWDCTS
jgi:Fe-S-cluster containining protein